MFFLCPSLMPGSHSRTCHVPQPSILARVSSSGPGQTPRGSHWVPGLPSLPASTALLLEFPHLLTSSFFSLSLIQTLCLICVLPPVSNVPTVDTLCTGDQLWCLGLREMQPSDGVTAGSRLIAFPPAMTPPHAFCTPHRNGAHFQRCFAFC